MRRTAALALAFAIAASGPVQAENISAAGRPAPVTASSSGPIGSVASVGSSVVQFVGIVTIVAVAAVLIAAND